MFDSSLNILVVDDDKIIRDACREILENEHHHAIAVESGLQALAQIEQTKFDLIFTDLKMPGMSGLELIAEIKKVLPQADIIVLTGYATIESAVEAMKLGIYDYVPKPFTPGTIRKILQNVVDRRKLLYGSAGKHVQLIYNENQDALIGQSTRMIEVYDLVHKVAPTDSTVLITGESGTGKELIAKAIHHNSLRRDKPFLTVDCGSLVETLFESELFGHVKGSFTGAIATKHGSFELANGGTFFFDEIGNISLNIQAKILRAIQEKEIKRVGDTKTIKVNVRVIAATNLDLRQKVESGAFREDLFYRLSVIPIHLPSLRERKEDIIPLAEHFLNKFRHKRKRDLEGFDERALQAMMNYDWHGNVRELENVIERAAVFEEGPEISLQSLPSIIRETPQFTSHPTASIKTLEDVEREHIEKALAFTNWNRTQTAKLLGIDRKTLYDKIKKYRLIPT
ncbi:sigma-54-dependent Fis family transcriptional regulator [candidate division KSB1 bacterium]|nr:sigma-54-dependent Fis family transcriptional regulator [candidate division KSB1 bacterium]